MPIITDQYFTYLGRKYLYDLVNHNGSYQILFQSIFAQLFAHYCQLRRGLPVQIRTSQEFSSVFKKEAQFHNYERHKYQLNKLGLSCIDNSCIENYSSVARLLAQLFAKKRCPLQWVVQGYDMLFQYSKFHPNFLFHSVWVWYHPISHQLNEIPKDNGPLIDGPPSRQALSDTECFLRALLHNKIITYHVLHRNLA